MRLSGVAMKQVKTFKKDFKKLAIRKRFEACFGVLYTHWSPQWAPECTHRRLRMAIWVAAIVCVNF